MLILLVLISLISVVLATDINPQVGLDTTNFEKNFEVLYGTDHLKVLDNSKRVQLYMDQYTRCGFRSKANYGSGFFHINMKIPDNSDTHGVLPNFYLTFSPVPQDELDFEFYGNDTLPILLQTNVFVHGIGNREQKISLWFDPRADFHSYTIMWNEWHIVFYVDEIPIREFRNLSGLAVGYPSQPMHVRATLWAVGWDAAGRPIPWSLAPFISSYTGFNVYGCPAQDIPSREKCHGPELWWNRNNYLRLSKQQKRQMETARWQLVYDYCIDKMRHPIKPSECLSISSST